MWTMSRTRFGRFTASLLFVMLVQPLWAQWDPILNVAPDFIGSSAVPVTTCRAGGLRYVDAVNTCAWSGSDVGAWINSALASGLPTFTTANGATIYGTIVLAPATYFYVTPIVINSPLITLDLSGSILSYTGNGVGITCNDAPTSYAGWGSIKNGVLLGTSTRGAIGIVDQECTRLKLENLRIADFTAGTALQLKNTRNWTEQTEIDHVELDNNRIGIDLYNNGGSGSFAYSNWHDLLISVRASGTGIWLHGNSFLAGGSFTVKFFLGNSSTAIHLQDAAYDSLSEWYIRGELSWGASAARGVVTESGTGWRNLERRWWNSVGITDTFAYGSRTAYINHNFNGLAWTADDPFGLSIGLGGVTTKYGTLDVSAATAARRYYLPDTTGLVDAIAVADVGNLLRCTSGTEGLHAVAKNCSAACSAGRTCTPGGNIHCELYCGTAGWKETGLGN